jgi:DNA-directed RNA polymerase subunit RPC12/RpoP
MSIAFVCPNGHQLNAPEDLAGKPGKCPKCGMKFLIPTLEEAAASAHDEEAAPEGEAEQASQSNAAREAAAAGKSKRFKEIFVFLCPNGHRLNGPPSLKGKPGKCPHCGAKFMIPDDEDAPPDPAEEEVPTGEVVEEAEEIPEPQEETQEEPEVHELPPDESEPEMPQIEVVANWHLPPPELMGGHRLAELFTWMWAQREARCIIELVMKDGQILTPKLFAPELSQQNYGVFAMRDDMGKFTMLTLCWENVAKVIIRNLDEIPQSLFE